MMMAMTTATNAVETVQILSDANESVRLTTKYAQDKW